MGHFNGNACKKDKNEGDRNGSSFEKEDADNDGDGITEDGGDVKSAASEKLYAKTPQLNNRGAENLPVRNPVVAHQATASTGDATIVNATTSNATADSEEGVGSTERIRQSPYNVTTIARDVLRAAGRHPTLTPLNWNHRADFGHGEQKDWQRGRQQRSEKGEEDVDKRLEQRNKK